MAHSTTPRTGPDRRQHQRHHDDQVGRSQHGVRGPPAQGAQQGGEHSDDDQLADSVARDGDAVRKPSPPDEPSRYHHADRRDRGGGVADGVDKPVDDEDMPVRLYLSREPYTQGGYQSSDREYRAYAVPVDQPPGNGHRQGGNEHEGRECQRELRPAPSQIVRHGLEHQPKGVARAAVEEQHGESRCQDYRAVVEPAQSGL